MKRICLGKIVAAHGVKGLVKILPFGDDVSLLNATLFTSESGGETLAVTLKNPLGKYILAEIKDIQDRTLAEEMRGTSLYIDRDALPQLEDEDGYYLEDFAGLKVLDQTGVEIGKVIAADNYGAEDLLDIRLKTGVTFLLPIRDETVPDINIAEGFVTIDDYENFVL